MESNPLPIKKKKIRGLETAWIECGNKNQDCPVLLFFHGCPDTPHTWIDQIEHFKKDYQIIAPFARGVQPSAASHQAHRYSLDSIVLDCLEILRSVEGAEKKQVVVVGHDIGALHAFQMAEVLSARLKCLILINGLSLSLLAQRLTHVRQLIKSWYIWFFQVPILSSYWIKRWDKKLTALAYKAGNHLETNPKKSAQALSPFLPHYQSAARALFSSFFQNKIKIEAPTLVLWSGSDAFLEIPSQTEMTKYVSHPTIRVLEGHHWIHQEDSDHVNRLIRQFIEGVK